MSVLLSSPRSFTVVHFYAPLSVFFVGGSSTRLQPYMKFGWFYLAGNPSPSITSTLRDTVSLIAARHRDFIEREDLPLFFLTSSSKIHPDYSDLQTKCTSNCFQAISIIWSPSNRYNRLLKVFFFCLNEKESFLKFHLGWWILLSLSRYEYSWEIFKW